jgi:hypothetical protein
MKRSMFAPRFYEFQRPFNRTFDEDPMVGGGGGRQPMENTVLRLRGTEPGCETVKHLVQNQVSASVLVHKTLFS